MSVNANRPINVSDHDRKTGNMIGLPMGKG